MGLGANTSGACWVFALYWLECDIGLTPTYLHLEAALSWNIARTARANPRMPLCVLTGMRRSQVISIFEGELGKPLATKLASRVAVVNVPCPAPPAELGARDGQHGCPACSIARQALPPPRPLPPEASRRERKELELVAALRYGLLYKVRALAYVPYRITVVLDADAALCPNARRAVLGEAEALSILDRSVGVRYHRRSVGPRVGAGRAGVANLTCEEGCGQVIDGALVRTSMRCAGLCAGRAVAHEHDGCGANTGVIVVRRTAEAAAFARTWYARYYAQITTPRNGSLINLSGDQRSFGSNGLKQGRGPAFARACAAVANLPRNLHVGRGEVAQGQAAVYGPVIAVHGCKAQELDKGSCPLYTACCSRRGRCADIDFD